MTGRGIGLWWLLLVSSASFLYAHAVSATERPSARFSPLIAKGGSESARTGESGFANGIASPPRISDNSVWQWSKLKAEAVFWFFSQVSQRSKRWLSVSLLEGAAPKDDTFLGGLTGMPKDGFARRRMLDNGLGATPPMGWSSWTAVGVNVTEMNIRDAADALVSSSLKDAGYIYVNLDDGWAGYERDANGDLTIDTAKFPSGIRGLSDYVHSKGLKFGIYSSAGPQACSGRLGSLLHEDQDAQWFAAQGVDFLKYDSCDDGKSGLTVEQRFSRMRDALAKVDRPIFYAMGYWGTDIACGAGPVGNSWRTYFDIYSSVARVFLTADENNQYAGCQGPNFGWNDADALQVGRLTKPNGAADFDAERTQMTLWSIMKSPLIVGYSVPQMGEQRLAILKQKEVIAINQDALGKQATKRYNKSGQEVWAGPLSGNRLAVALVNRNAEVTQQILVDWRTVGLDPDAKMTARDVWRRTNLPGDHTTNLGPLPVVPHGTVLLVLSPVRSTWYHFWNWEPIGGGLITPWLIALGVVILALIVASVLCGRKGLRLWTPRGPPRGTRKHSDGADAIPLQDRPEKKTSPIRTQRSGLRREASTRINRTRSKAEAFEAV